MPNIWDLAVVGGGASGIAAAIAAAALGDHVLLLEQSSALGRKIAASGNGRCNLMNTGVPVYYGDTAFAEDVLRHYTPHNLQRYFEEIGLVLSFDEAGRVYPCTYHSGTVLDALKTALRRNNVNVLLQTEVQALYHKDSLFTIKTNHDLYTSRRVLIAAGGAASAKLGGTFSGYRLLEMLGHPVIKPQAALCPLITDSKSISGLSGIRVRCSVSLYDDHHILLTGHDGELLFTDYGISGICAMQCARFIQENCKVELDFTKRLFCNSDELKDLLSRRKKQFSDLPPEYLLNGILVPKLSFAVLKQAGIELRNSTVGDITVNELESIAERMQHYTLHIISVKGMESAQVTAGGAVCDSFSAATLESHIISGLHVSGELLNVDGDCGGFNLMFAFASGILAGLNGRCRKE